MQPNVEQIRALSQQMKAVSLFFWISIDSPVSLFYLHIPQVSLQTQAYAEPLVPQKPVLLHSSLRNQSNLEHLFIEYLSGN